MVPEFSGTGKVEMIRIKETIIPEEVLGKWQKIADIMADILTVPSAIPIGLLEYGKRFDAGNWHDL